MQQDVWQTIAAHLSPGQKRRWTCCKPGSAVITRTVTRATMHCFRCGDTQVQHLDTQILLRARKALLAVQDAARSTSICRTGLPGATPVDVACGPAGLVWLGRAGITAAVAAGYGVHWSEQAQSILIPCQRGADVLWLARPMLGTGPKYLWLGQAGKPRDGAIWFRAGVQPSPVLVVEDVLSGIRLHRLGFSALSCIGTNLSRACIGAALRAGADTAQWVTWFDPDRAGARAEKQAVLLGLYGIAHTGIRSTRDPKLHSDEEIREYVRGVSAGATGPP